jgi:hypothetical protein
VDIVVRPIWIELWTDSVMIDCVIDWTPGFEESWFGTDKVGWSEGGNWDWTEKIEITNVPQWGPLK